MLFMGKWDSDAGEIALPLTTTGAGIFAATQESKEPYQRVGQAFEERLDGCDGKRRGEGEAAGPSFVNRTKPLYGGCMYVRLPLHRWGCCA